MSDAPRRSYTDTPELPVGTWSYQPGQLGGFLLWQQTEAGPHYVGSVNSLASADFIVERLNEVPQPASVAQGSGDCGVIVEREDLVEIIASWEDAANYKGDYLREKHGDTEEIAKFRAKYLPPPSTEGK